MSSKNNTRPNMILRRDQPSHHSYSPGGSTELGYTPIAEKEGIKNYQNSRKSTGGKRNRNNSKNSKNVFQGMERRVVRWRRGDTFPALFIFRIFPPKYTDPYDLVSSYFDPLLNPNT